MSHIFVTAEQNTGRATQLYGALRATHEETLRGFAARSAAHYGNSDTGGDEMRKLYMALHETAAENAALINKSHEAYGGRQA